MKNIAVLGDGGWGTTLSILLAKKGHAVTLWSAFPEYVKILKEKHENPRFLPGIKIPAKIQFSPDLQETLNASEIIVIAIPSQFLRGTLNRIKKLDYPGNAIFVSVTKGIENKSLKRVSEVIYEELGKVKLGVLSGPTIAHEVASGVPTTAVIASKEPGVRARLQDVFMTERFRVYTNSDLIGVELGGSLKNVIAIACGISDGLGFGSNTKAALLSRGLAEISRLGKAMGAKSSTFSGISGLGDLVTTCISQYSRNRFVGQQIGQGKTLKEITEKMAMVAEGVPTCLSAYKLSLKHRVDAPIIQEVYRVLYKQKSALKAVSDLMTREKKQE